MSFVSEAGPVAQSDVEALIDGDPRILADPYPLYRALRETAPVYQLGTRFVLTRYDDVKLVYQSSESFVRGRRRARHDAAIADGRLAGEAVVALADVAALTSDFIIGKSGEEHERLRKIAHRAFTPRRVQELVASIDAHAESLLAPHLEDEVTDLTPYAYRMPLAVLLDMLGIPFDDREDVHRWSAAITAQIGHHGELDEATLFRAQTASRDFGAYLTDMLDNRLRQLTTRTDLLTDLLGAQEDGRMTDLEVISVFAELLIAGHETTTALIGNGLLELLRHRDQWRLLCERPDLAPHAVEELLRFLSPVATNVRTVGSEDVELGDLSFPAGSTVFPFLPAANRDPAVFEEPERLKLLRSDAGRHIAFGFGAHFCIGNQVARREAAAALGTLARRFPEMELVDDNPEWFGTVMLRRPRRLLVSLGVTTADLREATMPNYSTNDPEYWEGVREPLPGIRSKGFAMGSLPPSAARVLVLEMDPGFVIARHAHSSARFEMIVKGSLHIGDRVFHAGDVMMADAHEFYGPKVCGPEGCTTVEFFAGDKGGASLVFELADGTTVPYGGESELPDNLAEAEWIERQQHAILSAATTA